MIYIDLKRGSLDAEELINIKELADIKKLIIAGRYFADIEKLVGIKRSFINKEELVSIRKFVRAGRLIGAGELAGVERCSADIKRLIGAERNS